MGLLGFYLRKLVTIFKGEILVLPSRIVVLVFFVVLLLFPVLIEERGGEAVDPVGVVPQGFERRLEFRTGFVG
jgi:hypothetical protein